MSKSKHTAEKDIEKQQSEEVKENQEQQVAAEDTVAADEKENVSADSTSEEIDRMNATIAEWKDKYLRLTAEYDNYRKRTRNEMDELRKTAGESTIKDILGVVDDFERALQALEKLEDTAGFDGVKLIYDKFMSTLKGKGVEAIDRVNEDFDTDFEEAITKFPAPTPELKGKVIEVIQKGYTLNGKVIRFAKVVVGE
ncbi:nucleotide exchange factor GrpE [Alistipes sp. ZOR0009]|uniref:nucleotide exchange factor GrpE n=1 Tax=Alistipes sp. ZOR0009 TaxID=1339253 RepID=UPI0006488E29|nr:nucleotide exchange factor GrpE [Alistipes sp. ZOR0009]